MARSKHHKFKRRKGLNQPKMIVSDSAWRAGSNKRRMISKLAITQQIEMEAKQMIADKIQNDVNETSVETSVKSSMGVIDESR